MTDHSAWLQEQMLAQRKFFHGIVIIIIAIVMRWLKIILPGESSVTLSKVTFQLFFPTLLLAKISKANLRSEDMEACVASLCTAGFIAVLCVCFSRFIPKDNGFRGQWTYSMIGNNIGLVYPLVLSVPELADRIFGAVVAWDITGNCLSILVFNYIIAIRYSPLKSQSDAEMVGIVNKDEPNHNLEAAGSEQNIEKNMNPDVIGNTDDHQNNECPNSLVIPTSPNSADRVGAVQSVKSSRSQVTLMSIEVMATAGVTGLHNMRKRAMQSSGMTLVKKLAQNIVLIAVIVAVAINFSGWRIPEHIDEFLESLAGPYSILLFFILGLNLKWSMIRPKLREVAFITVCRLLIAGVISCFFWFTPFLSTKALRQACATCLFCPVSGITVSYTIELGYDRGLQAALVTTTNVVSLLVLLLLTTFGQA